MASLVTPLAMLVMVGAVVSVMLVVVLMVLVAGMRLPEAVGCRQKNVVRILELEIVCFDGW